MAKSAGYWERRSAARLVDAEKQSEEYINRIQKMYSRASKNAQREIENIYKNYSKETGLDESQLKVLLSVKETGKLWKQMKKRGLDKYILDNYKSRISRLEQIQAQLYMQTKELYSAEQKESTECYRGIINESYPKAIYDVQQGTGYDFPFNKIDENLVNKLLNEPWSGKNYGQRIWTNTDILANSISEVIGGALLSGQGIEKTERQIRERFAVGKFYSTRLVRTEANHFHNEADAMAYEEMGIDEYVFLAVLDGRTSPVCQEHDNKKYKFSERVSGENFPPLHPNCRSTTRAYLGEEVEAQLKRSARDPVTGKTNLVDNNMSYPEWKESVYAAHEKEKADNSLKDPLRFKRVKPADQQQFENYRSRLAESPYFPKTLEEFKEIKYNKKDEYERLKREYKTIGKIERKSEDAIRDKKTYYDFRNANIETTQHFIYDYHLRMYKKNGEINYDFDKIVEVSKKEPNYFDEQTNRNVRYYDRIILISEKDTNEMVSMRKGGIKSAWKKI